jgi:succinate dehydrogenase/fumarate reductase flavoprotein subunit
LRQPGGVAWNVFDGRIAVLARQFEDFCAAEQSGAVFQAPTIERLAALMQVPFEALKAEWDDAEGLKEKGGQDRFGRKFRPDQQCAPSFHAVRVTGALFHTQGGLVIDASARVKRRDGLPFPNLFAAGGAATGVSGTTAAGYLSGNGLLTATVLGRIAGQGASTCMLG